jgi:mRNA interferase ChpB
VKRGEIWIVDLAPTVGHEIRSARPVMIVSSEEFTKVTGLTWVVAITAGGNRSRSAGFSVPLIASGLTTAGMVACEQIRAIDMASRKGRYVETAPDILVDQVVGMAEAILAG